MGGQGAKRTFLFLSTLFPKQNYYFLSESKKERDLNGSSQILLDGTVGHRCRMYKPGKI